MTKSAAELIDSVSEEVSGVEHNFKRASQLAAQISLNSDEIESLEKHVQFLVGHLIAVQAAVSKALTDAQRVVDIIKQPASVS